MEQPDFFNTTEIRITFIEPRCRLTQSDFNAKTSKLSSVSQLTASANTPVQMSLQSYFKFFAELEQAEPLLVIQCGQVKLNFVAKADYLIFVEET